MPVFDSLLHKITYMLRYDHVAGVRLPGDPGM